MRLRGFMLRGTGRHTARRQAYEKAAPLANGCGFFGSVTEARFRVSGGQRRLL